MPTFILVGKMLLQFLPEKNADNTKDGSETGEGTSAQAMAGKHTVQRKKGNIVSSIVFSAAKKADQRSTPDSNKTPEKEDLPIEFCRCGTKRL